MCLHSDTSSAESEPNILCSYSLMLRAPEKKQIPILQVFGLTRSCLKPRIYHTQGEHANYYINDEVQVSLDSTPSGMDWEGCASPSGAPGLSHGVYEVSRCPCYLILCFTLLIAFFLHPACPWKLFSDLCILRLSSWVVAILDFQSTQKMYTLLRTT